MSPEKIADLSATRTRLDRFNEREQCELINLGMGAYAPKVVATTSARVLPYAKYLLSSFWATAHPPTPYTGSSDPPLVEEPRSDAPPRRFYRNRRESRPHGRQPSRSNIWPIYQPFTRATSETLRVGSSVLCNCSQRARKLREWLTSFALGFNRQGNTASKISSNLPNSLRWPRLQAPAP